jgi:hypothetical protein
MMTTIGQPRLGQSLASNEDFGIPMVVFYHDHGVLSYDRGSTHV